VILVEVESPYSASTDEGVAENVRYARACMRDCIDRGEAPLASHLLYTQPGILDDGVPEERRMGMEAGKAWSIYAHKVCVYMDRGVSEGMRWGIERARRRDIAVEYRRLGGEWDADAT
jgi:hypothetical protein